MPRPKFCPSGWRSSSLWKPIPFGAVPIRRPKNRISQNRRHPIPDRAKTWPLKADAFLCRHWKNKKGLIGIDWLVQNRNTLKQYFFLPQANQSRKIGAKVMMLVCWGRDQLAICAARDSLEHCVQRIRNYGNLGIGIERFSVPVQYSNFEPGKFKSLKT